MITIISHIAPEPQKSEISRKLRDEDLYARAETVVKYLDMIGCGNIVKSDDIVAVCFFSPHEKNLFEFFFLLQEFTRFVCDSITTLA